MLSWDSWVIRATCFSDMGGGEPPSAPPVPGDPDEGPDMQRAAGAGAKRKYGVSHTHRTLLDFDPDQALLIWSYDGEKNASGRLTQKRVSAVIVVDELLSPLFECAAGPRNHIFERTSRQSDALRRPSPDPGMAVPEGAGC